MTLEVVLRTRGKGRRLDYRDFPQAPTFDWATEPLARFTRAEAESLIVRSRDGHVQVRFTGLTSSRVDAVGTPIRYTLYVRGRADERDTLIARLTLAALSPEHRQRLSECLDRAVGEQIEGWYAVADASLGKQVIKAIRPVLPRLAPKHGGIDDLKDGLVVVGEHRVDAPHRDRIRAVAEGRPGVAALVNLTEKPDDFTFLGDDGLNTIVMRGSDAPAKVVAGTLGGGDPRGANPKVWGVALMSVALIVLLTAVVMAIWLVR